MVQSLILKIYPSKIFYVNEISTFPSFNDSFPEAFFASLLFCFRTLRIACCCYRGWWTSAGAVVCMPTCEVLVKSLIGKQTGKTII